MRYEIYQIKNCEGCNYVFRSWETARKNFKFSDYMKVYDGFCKDGNIHNTLEDLFEIFNLKRPLNFKGHSLSVSDIVCVDSKTYFYCDSFGWVDITKYVCDYYFDAINKVTSKLKDSQGFSQGDKKNGYI